MEKAIAIIPARYDSKRLPGKPLRKILNRPLIEWVYESASKASALDEVFVTTDSEEVISCVKGFGGKVIKTSSHHQSGTDRVGEASKKLHLSPEDVVVNIQSDEPLISPRALKALISSIAGDKGIEMATLIYPSSKRDEFEDANVVKVVVDKDDFALYFSRSPIPHFGLGSSNRFVFLKHLGVYGYTMRFLQKIIKITPSSLEKRENLEQLRVLEHGYKIKVVRSLDDSASVNIEEDLKKVERLILKEPVDNHLIQFYNSLIEEREV